MKQGILLQHTKYHHICFFCSVNVCCVSCPLFSHVHIGWQLLSFQTAVSGCVRIRTETRAEVRKNCNSAGMLADMEKVKLSSWSLRFIRHRKMAPVHLHILELFVFVSFLCMCLIPWAKCCMIRRLLTEQALLIQIHPRAQKHCLCQGMSQAICLAKVSVSLNCQTQSMMGIGLQWSWIVNDLFSIS